MMEPGWILFNSSTKHDTGSMQHLRHAGWRWGTQPERRPWLLHTMLVTNKQCFVRLPGITFPPSESRDLRGRLGRSGIRGWLWQVLNPIDRKIRVCAFVYMHGREKQTDRQIDRELSRLSACGNSIEEKNNDQDPRNRPVGPWNSECLWDSLIPANSSAPLWAGFEFGMGRWNGKGRQSVLKVFKSKSNKCK